MIIWTAPYSKKGEATCINNGPIQHGESTKPILRALDFLTVAYLFTFVNFNTQLIAKNFSCPSPPHISFHRN